MRRARQAARSSPDTARRFSELEETSRALARFSLVVPKSTEVAAHHQKLVELSNQVERLEHDLAAENGELREQLGRLQCTSEVLRHSLPNSTVLVDFLEYDHLLRPKSKGGSPQFERRLAAFIVQPKKPVERVELGPVAPIAVAIDVWRGLNTPHPGMSPFEQKIFYLLQTKWKQDFGDQDPGRKIRELVWDKIEPHLDKAQVVLISPDGATARFPWPALPGREPGSYLIEQLAVAIVPVPSLLPELIAGQKRLDTQNTDEPRAATMLLVGDVDFDADPGQAAIGSTTANAPRKVPVDEGLTERWHCTALTGTRSEISAIAESFEQQFSDGFLKKLSRDEATKGQVVKKMPKGEYLHFATHGFFASPGLRSALYGGSQAQPDPAELFAQRDIAGYHPDLLSGLALTGANRGPTEGKDDGILTALEVEQLDLGRAKLVTLSACETGLGETAGGEGVLGLQRAFQIAGAKSVVATVWSVSSGATHALMVEFYRNLWQKKMTKLEALRQAQLKMLRDEFPRPGKSADDQSAAKDRRLPPFFWGAFVLSGDWR
jgi:CHAT domain-containing protein